MVITVLLRLYMILPPRLLISRVQISSWYLDFRQQAAQRQQGWQHVVLCMKKAQDSAKILISIFASRRISSNATRVSRFMGTSLTRALVSNSHNSPAFFAPRELSEKTCFPKACAHLQLRTLNSRSENSVALVSLFHGPRFSEFGIHICSSCTVHLFFFCSRWWDVDTLGGFPRLSCSGANVLWASISRILNSYLFFLYHSAFSVARDCEFSTPLAVFCDS